MNTEPTDKFGRPPRPWNATFVVIPAYNEERVIADVVQELRHKLPELEVVVVNDGSSDRTSRVLSRLAVHHLDHPINLGQGASLQTGISYALKRGARYIVTYDADGQHSPEDIPRLVEPIRRGECDVVLGSRFLGRQAVGLRLKRHVLLKAATYFTRLTTGLSLTDTHNGARAFSRRSAKRLEIEQNGMAHASEILEKIARMKFRWQEIPVTIRYTEYSQAKGQRASNMINILWDLFVGRN